MEKLRIPTKWIILIANVVIINWAIISFLNLSYPLVGHDYGLAIPQFLDTALHFRTDGLNIQWYTPTLGGGLPAFPNPNNSQFSLLELPVIFIPPWDSVILTTIIFVSIGFFASYRIFSKVLQFNWTSSVLGAIFFSANGFMMERIAVGHLGYQPFPILALFLLVLLDSSIPTIIACLLFGLLVTLLIHQAGYFLIVSFGLSFLVIFPLIYLFKRNALDWKRIFLVVLGGGFLAILMSASKLSAVFSFMRFFPRTIKDNYQSTTLLALTGVAFQLLGTMNLVPLSWVAGNDQNTLPGIMSGLVGYGYGYWEFDMSMSPIVFGILLAGINIIFHKRKQYKDIFFRKQRWIGWLALIISTWLILEFILAKGFAYPLLSQLPILSSLHVNNRFTAALLFPLALISTYIYNRWAITWTAQKALVVLILANIFALVPLATYFSFKDDLQDRFYNITTSYRIHRGILAEENFDITKIGILYNDTFALPTRTSSLYPYEPIFGYGLENFHPEVKPGSIWDISNGYYNMTNPSGYVFPEINNTRPFERIKVAEKDKLVDFAQHKQPDWKLPIYQQVLNYVSSISFIAVLLALIWLCWKSIRSTK